RKRVRRRLRRPRNPARRTEEKFQRQAQHLLLLLVQAVGGRSQGLRDQLAFLVHPFQLFLLLVDAFLVVTQAAAQCEEGQGRQPELSATGCASGDGRLHRCLRTGEGLRVRSWMLRARRTRRKSAAAAAPTLPASAVSGGET